MDPFGFAASVATVAEMALKVFTNLNTFYRKFRDAPQHSKELRDGLDLLVDLLTEVQDTLEGGPRANRYGPPLKEFDQIKQWLSELQRERADCRRHADLARARLAVGVFPILIPAELPIVEGEATNMSAVKSNKLAKGADAGVVASRSVFVVSNVRAYRFERSLSE